MERLLNSAEELNLEEVIFEVTIIPNKEEKHGCTKCYSPEEICKKDRNKTMKELYDQTKERLKTIDYLRQCEILLQYMRCEFESTSYLKTCMNKISFKCPHRKHIDASSDPTLNKHDKIHEIKRCKECKNIKNEKCIHSDEERVIVGTWSTIEIDKAIEKVINYKKIYELEHFEKTSTDIFKLYVDTFMKYKQEASGCKCDPKYCKNDCKNDKECKTKIQYIIDNTAYDLDIDKIKYNSGLRFIAKICF
ncbi:unnamed protein product [Mytilus edulis]|uniref:Uncharacterized protein n=1 Tax=Mytilus edulis TaxID=6550 RepID=A0A8S3QHE9_MYTED|nr:unnamed protein product [Mytilus edulis]